VDTRRAKATLATSNSNVAVVETADQHEETSHAILALTPKMQRFVHLYSTGQYSLQKLGTLLELHPNTLGNWLKRTDVKGIIAEMQESTHEVVTNQLKIMTAKAADKLSTLIDSPIDGVALQAVKDVLDRAGHKPKQEIKIDKTVTTIEEKMKQLINSTIVDADYEVVE
jgi:transposase-like protein